MVVAAPGGVKRAPGDDGLRDGTSEAAKGRRQASDRAGLDEEYECGSRKPGEQRQLGRSRRAQWARGNQVDKDPDRERGSRLGKAEEDLEDEVAHESDRPTALERPNERDLVRVLEVAADRQAPG